MKTALNTSLSDQSSKNESQSPVDIALGFARQEILIFPADPKEKSPYVKWKDEATCDVDIIKNWWQRWPGALIAIPTGRTNGLIVIDIDIKKGKNGYESLKNAGLHTDVHAGYSNRVKTQSGGEHRYFRSPELEVPNSTDRIGRIDCPGIDIRGDGGYVIAAGSIMKNGKAYENIDLNLDQVPELPEKISKILQLKAEAAKEATKRYPDNNEFNAEDFALVPTLLDHIDSDPHEHWRNVGMICKTEFGESGRVLWDNWSQQSHKFDTQKQEKQWHHFKPQGQGEQRFASLIKMAIEGGYQPSEGFSNFSSFSRPGSSNSQIDPIPLVKNIEPGEEFPIDALGPVMGNAALAIQEITKAPLPIAVNSLLAVANLVAQARYDVQFPAGRKPISLFLVTIAKSGERKTAVDDRALEAIDEQRKTLLVQYKEEIETYQDEKDAFEAQRKIILNDMNDNYEDKKKNLKIIGQKPTKPLQPRLTVSEPTPEGAAHVLINDIPVLGVFATEGGQFVGGHGMSDEAKLRNATFYSRLWDSGDVERTRAKEGSTGVYGRRLCIHLQIQPRIAADFFTDQMLLDQGFLSRVLPTFPESTMGQRPWSEPSEKSITALSEFHDCIKAIIEEDFILSDDGQNALVASAIEFSIEAKQRWIEYSDLIDIEVAPGGSRESISGLANKLPEHAARIAATIEAVEAFIPNNPINAVTIGEDRFLDAQRIAEWFAQEAYRIYEQAQLDAEIIDAQNLLEWIKQKWPEIATSAGREPNTISLSDIYQSGPGAIRTARKARKISGVLNDHGYLIPLKDGIEVDGKQRREAWVINPGEE